MTLLELLVQELPKRGGWTVGSLATQDGVLSADGCCVSFWDEAPEAYGDGEKSFWADSGTTRANKGYGVRILGDFEVAEDFSSSIISREQYEAALAASKQPVWDGEGLPPIGCICEALAPSRKGDPWSWQRVKVVEAGIDGAEKECLVYNIETTRPSWVDEFRPIRTEAERKREEVIKHISHSLRANGSITDEQLNRLYDDIVAGMITGIKLAD